MTARAVPGTPAPGEAAGKIAAAGLSSSDLIAGNSPATSTVVSPNARPGPLGVTGKQLELEFALAAGAEKGKPAVFSMGGLGGEKTAAAVRALPPVPERRLDACSITAALNTPPRFRRASQATAGNQMRFSVFLPVTVRDWEYTRNGRILEPWQDSDKQYRLAGPAE